MRNCFKMKGINNPEYLRYDICELKRRIKSINKEIHKLEQKKERINQTLKNKRRCLA